MKSMVTVKALLFFCVLFIGIPFGSMAQRASRASKAAAEQEVSDTSRMTKDDMVKRFNAYVQGFYSSEKVFVHTDKDAYMGGETIWMRAYRTESSTHSPFYYSGLMYIEIRDPENRQISHMQIMRTDSVFQATYKIPMGTPSGLYELVAYTNMMQNYDDAYYFRKRFYVYNSTDNNIASSISFLPNPDGKNVQATIKVLGLDDQPYRDATLAITPYINGNKRDVMLLSVNRNGEVNYKFRRDENLTGLHIQFDRERPIKYQRYFKVPIFEDSIDVKFMPEGGHMLAGVMQQMAFKAVKADGKSIEVKGQVKDSLGNMVGFFESQHLGMGRFPFQAESGKSYTAEVTTEDGRLFSFPLPPVVDTGVVVSAASRNGKLTFRVQGTEGFDYTGLSLVVHNRGRLISWESLEAVKGVQLDVPRIPEGITHCFVVDDYGKKYSERIVFINKDQTPDVKVNGVRSSYGRRQKVDLELDVILGGTQPLPSDLSVAVLDAKTTMLDDNGNNIISYMLLSSDIKGRIENPTYYFDKSIPLAERNMKADLLMMTQGWRRYDIDAIFSGKRPNLEYVVEQGQFLAGKIKPLWRKSTDSGKITVVGLNPSENFRLITMADADTSGFFELKGISFPKGTTFIVQGTQKDGKTNVEVEMEKQKFAPISRDLLAGRNVYEPEVVPADTVADFFKSRGSRYIYENGERILVLDAAEVTARKSGDFEADMYDDNASNKINSDQLIEQGYTNVEDWLNAVGAEVRFDDETSQQTIYIRNRPARLRVDGFAPFGSGGHSEVLRLPVSQIEGIWLFRDGMAMDVATGEVSEFASAAAGGIIVRTKGGAGVASGPRKTASFFQFQMGGYSKPAEFYVTKYDGTDNSTQYDERTTVHWDPKVKTDMNGKAKVSFYTTDVPTDYTVVIQGMSGTGQMGIPIYHKFNIKTGM